MTTGRTKPNGATTGSTGAERQNGVLGGLSSKSLLAGRGIQRPRHGETVDAVTHVLREAILDGTLSPSSWLREAELASALSVSRTPVREALRRLTLEGLVVATPHQGSVVSSLSIDDILHVYTVRETLEGLAARLAASKRSEQELNELNETLRRMQDVPPESNPRELSRLNLVFHRVIRRAAGNQYLDHFLTQVEHSVRRFRHTTYEYPGRAEESLEEHRCIVAAIAAGDPVMAEKWAVSHMRRAREVRIQMLLDS